MRIFYFIFLLYFLVAQVCLSDEVEEFICKFNNSGNIVTFVCDDVEFSNPTAGFVSVFVKDLKGHGMSFWFLEKGFFILTSEEWTNILNETPIAVCGEKRMSKKRNIQNPIVGRNGKRHFSYHKDSFFAQYMLSPFYPKNGEDNIFANYIKEFRNLCLKQDFDKVFRFEKETCGILYQKNDHKFLFWKPFRGKLTIFYGNEKETKRILIVFKEENGTNFIAWEIIKKKDKFFYYEYASDEQIFWLDVDGDGLFDKAAKYNEFGNLVFYELKKELIQSMVISEDE